jgi:myo-inositol-1-phosphate synthase
LSFYLKSPQTQHGIPAKNDIFKQLNTLKQVLRAMMNEETVELPALEISKKTEVVI